MSELFLSVRLTHFSQPYDLLISEDLISFKEFGVVAHIHLATNLFTDWLEYFIGEMSSHNFEAVIRADSPRLLAC